MKIVIAQVLPTSQPILPKAKPYEEQDELEFLQCWIIRHEPASLTVKRPAL